jgi:hypothetical protein
VYSPAMLKTWHSLRKYPILNLKGVAFFKLRLKYLLLATMHPNRGSRKSKNDLIRSQGQVWSNFNLWLQFQATFVNQKKWAASPIIRGVTLVNLEEISTQKLEQISAESKQLISAAAYRFINTFNGINLQSYVNWITRNYLLANAFKEFGVTPFKDDRALIEIGPGLGPVLTLAILSKPVSVYSFDTFEMQEIFSAVQNEFQDDFKKLNKIAVNTEENREAFTLVREKSTVIAFWSFTELTSNERKRYLEIINESDYTLIATNEFFEGINNFEYLEQLAKLLGKRITYKKLTEVLGLGIPRYQHNHRIYLMESN